MGKQARNGGIFGAGKEFGECAGYAVDAAGEPIAQYNGMIAKRKRRTAHPAFAGRLNGNSWEMTAATGSAGEVLHVLIADEMTMAEVGGQLFQGLGIRTADMAIPAGHPCRWYVLKSPDYFFIGEENFTNAVGANRYAALAGFDLTAQAAAPASGQYFEIAEDMKISNIGGTDGGRLYTVDLRVKP